MSAGAALDRALAWQRTMIERTGAEPDIDRRRAVLLELMRERNGPLPADVEVVPVDAGGVPGEWLTPAGQAEGPVLLYAHGGGWTMGSAEGVREMVCRLARAGRCRALSVDYRLAPEHPFPAAVDDLATAYRWLLERGVDPSRIAVGGESAGGNVALAGVLALRDAGEPLPAAIAVLSPLTDMTGSGASLAAQQAVDPLSNAEFVRLLSELYLGATPREHPLASPLFADLAGLPPTLVQVGTAEGLLDDSRRLAARARAAGVDVTLEEWDGMVHLWQAFPDLPDARGATDSVGGFLRTRLGATVEVAR